MKCTKAVCVLSALGLSFIITLPAKPQPQDQTASSPDQDRPSTSGSAEPQPQSQPASAPAKETVATRVFAKASPAVVRIIAYDKKGTPITKGSGFFVSSDGLLLTNHHVIEHAESASVILANNEALRVAKVVATDKEGDLALLEAEGKDLACLTLAKSAPAVGARVYAIGNPAGWTNTISEGIISGSQEIGGLEWLQTTAPISPGSSGGPLLAPAGEVVGVTTLTDIRGQNLNFCAPLERIRKLVDTSDRTAGRELGTVTAKRRHESLAAIFDQVPKDIMPDRGANWSRLQIKLFNKWAEDNMAHCFLSHAGVFSHAGVLEGWDLDLVYASFKHEELRIGGRTYKLQVMCGLDDSSEFKVGKLKAGEKILVEGLVAGIRMAEPTTGDRLRRREKPKLRLAIVGLLTLQEKAKPKPPVATKPAKELTPEEAAELKLRLVSTYLSTGMKDKALTILRAIISDYPDTKAAEQAKETLKELQ